MHVLSRRTLQWTALAFEGGLGLLALLLDWLFEQPAWADLQFNATGVLLGILTCLPMLAGLVLCVVVPWAPLQHMSKVGDRVIRGMFAQATVFDMLWIAILAGIGEELFFRGFLQAILCGWLGVWLGIALAGAVFGVMHLLTPTYGVLAALVGCYLGVVWLVSGNLLVVIFAHGLYDFVALVYLLRVVRPALAAERRDDPVATPQAEESQN